MSSSLFIYDSEDNASINCIAQDLHRTMPEDYSWTQGGAALTFSDACKRLYHRCARYTS